MFNYWSIISKTKPKRQGRAWDEAKVSSMKNYFHLLIKGFWDTLLIVQGVQSSVDFILNGELASTSSRKLHKCELGVSVRTRPELHGGEQQSHLCNKFFETYYGAFIDPCTNDGKQSLKVPPSPSPPRTVLP